MTLIGFWNLSKASSPAQYLDAIAHGNETVLECSGSDWRIVALGPERGSLRPSNIRLVTENGQRHGLVIGKLFDRNIKPYPDSLPREFLNGSPWGSFCGAYSSGEGNQLRLVRDPLGTQRLFYAALERGFVFSSNLEYVIRLLGSRPAIDWEYLAAHIEHSAAVPTLTPFEEVRQVPAGTVLSFSGGGLVERPWWSPFDHFSADATVDATPAEIRSLISDCTNAWLGDTEEVVLELSGGLDSSTVAWAAAQSDRRLLAIHYDAGGISAASGEFEYANLIADLYDIDLVRVDSETADLFGFAPAAKRRATLPGLDHLLWGRSFPIDRVSTSNATCLSGFGGDQTFVASQLPHHRLHDTYKTRGRRELVRECQQVSHETGIPLPQLIHSLIRLETASVKGGARLARLLVAEMLEIFEECPWLLAHHDCERYCSPLDKTWHRRVPRGVSANKLRHALEIMVIDPFFRHQPIHPELPPTMFPLLSLPLLEVGLGTPISGLISPARNRILLRDAMEGVLPEKIFSRQGKAENTALVQHAIAAALPRLLELTTGQLADRGIIDPARAREDLQLAARGYRNSSISLLICLAVELWLDAW